MHLLPVNLDSIQTTKDAYAELVVPIDEQLNKLKKIMSEDVVKLNQLIHEKTLPVIGVKIG